MDEFPPIQKNPNFGKKVNLTLMEELDTQDKQDIKNIIEGVGKDEPIITNANGGMQSKSPSALYLVDADFMFDMTDTSNENGGASSAIDCICTYMKIKSEVRALYDAIECLEKNQIKALLTIGKVLQYGAERYSPNNWRLIPREEHLNHALIHLVALLAGDTQDDHKEHAMCRLMMAIATQETKGFSYTEPFKDEA